MMPNGDYMRTIAIVLAGLVVLVLIWMFVVWTG
jgi:hypothetical protein